jgi:hypothetical protein
VTVQLTTPTSVANMDGAEHDFCPVTTQFDTADGQRLGAPRFRAQRWWVRSSPLAGLAGASAFV